MAAGLGWLRFFVDWIVNRALPTWGQAGFDPVAGRFHERLDQAGAPLPVPHRAMVQARQIQVFAQAALRGWFPQGGALAERAMAALRRDFIHDDGAMASVAFSIDPAGRIVSDARDAYTHAFVLFALAWAYRLTGDAALLALADRLIAFVDAHLTDGAHGGLFDQAPTSADKRQNPLMHLLEAYLALERAAPGRGHAQRASAIVRLFEQRLFDADRGMLREHFARDWTPHPDPARAEIVEPGHLFEWAWLLHDHAAATGEDVARLAGPLFATARAHGVSPDMRVYDEISPDLRPIRRSHRLWPHTEAIKAAAVRHSGGDADALPFANAMARTLMTRFLDRPFAGGWIDHVDAALTPLVAFVPASSLYHLAFAAAEGEDAFIDGHAGRRAAGDGED